MYNLFFAHNFPEGKGLPIKAANRMKGHTNTTMTTEGVKINDCSFGSK